MIPMILLLGACVAAVVVEIFVTEYLRPRRLRREERRKQLEADYEEVVRMIGT